MLKPAPLTSEEWNMVATLMKDGSGFASLRQSVELQGATVPPPDLTSDQWTAVIIERITRLPSFEVYMFGAGVVDKDRALSELRSHSDVGRVLIEIEQNLINNSYARALDETA